jgi:hypothetical protein
MKSISECDGVCMELQNVCAWAGWRAEGFIWWVIRVMMMRMMMEDMAKLEVFAAARLSQRERE